MSSRLVLALVAVLFAYFLLFFGLDHTGLLGPDEPRYASIGREMFLSGDWITPRLWGEPWFEKPVLLYWMTGLAFAVGFGPELAPRLPVALMSLAFLVFYQRRLEHQWGRRAAWYSTAVLATSAGWAAFSHLGVTDLPMTACFSASLLMASGSSGNAGRKAVPLAGVLLGLAVLAKGLVPFALAVPLLWFWRRKIRALCVLFGVAICTAAPWYAACAWRNGAAFLNELFWRHHVERFASETIQHVQPVWFYVPVLLAGLVPWTPAFPLLLNRRLWSDPRRWFLLMWVCFGLLFFSAFLNKLPGYLLPLLPPACALIGIAIEEARSARLALTLPLCLLAMAPVLSGMLPQAVRSGISRAEFSGMEWLPALPFLAAAIPVWIWERRGRRDRAMACVSVLAVTAVVYLKAVTFPVMDRAVSTRQLWREVLPHKAEVCVENIHRAWRYGLNYYAVNPLPPCGETGHRFRIRQRPGEPAYLTGQAE